MEKKIIADTDVLIDLLSTTNVRHINTKRILLPLIADANVFISCITSMELLVGATNKVALRKIKTNLSAFPIIYLDIVISKLSIDLLQQYNLSHGLQIQDCFIAATALATSLPLFTYNTKDFAFIDGIELYENETLN